jgi:hypothetical protein
MKRTINLLAALVIVTSLFGQSPNAFNYQAVIRDANGLIQATKSEAIQISIIQGSATGTTVYTETFTATTTAYGLVSLAIGTGTQVGTPTFASINWANGPYYIELSLNGNVISTVQLLSVPYAKYADVAGNGFSGKYTDLTAVPATFPGDWTNITNEPTFAKVATTGSYTDLTNLPTNLFNGKWSALTGKPTLIKVDTTGSYNDLTNLPTLFSGSWTALTGTPTTLAGYGITDFKFTAPAANQLLEYNGTQWVNWTPTFTPQTITLTGNQLSISGGNTVTFTGWDTDSINTVRLTGNQTISGNKTFSGTLTASTAIVANAGLSAGNTAVTNVLDPVSAQDAATKNYVDVLKASIAKLQSDINSLATQLSITIP